MGKVIVIGAGAAGMMSACAAAQDGHEVILLERNEKAGKKIYITGKGRCNLTNDTETPLFFDNVVHGGRFLKSAVYNFDHDACKAFFEENGCPVKTERGERVFPVSDHASDVTKALTNRLYKEHVDIRYRTRVSRILTDTDEEGKPHVTGVRLEKGGIERADAVILCTGGLSYPSTGSDGDGYRMAGELGHTITDTAPSLVPFETKEEWCRSLQGLALKNVEVTIKPIRNEEEGRSGKKKDKPYQEFGEMLFTHFGVSGPIMLTASTKCDFKENPQGYICRLDLKPALTQEQVEKRLKREFEEAPFRHLPVVLRKLFPERLAEVMADLSGIGEERTVSGINDKEIRRFAQLIKGVPITLTGTRGYNEAIITRGGISTKEVDSFTMQSRIVDGLYFAGEVLDADAVTGGFNLQIAWSTGHLAGSSIGKRDRAGIKEKKDRE